METVIICGCQQQTRHATHARNPGHTKHLLYMFLTQTGNCTQNKIVCLADNERLRRYIHDLHFSHPHDAKSTTVKFQFKVLYKKSKNIMSGKTAHVALSKAFHCSLILVLRISLLYFFKKAHQWTSIDKSCKQLHFYREYRYFL